MGYSVEYFTRTVGEVPAPIIAAQHAVERGVPEDE
jgi:hypothetical protein